jgi:hypothetical protein
VLRKGLIIPAMAAAILMMAIPVAAITRGGEPDAGEHPYVGLMVADDADGNPLWRCTGALISPTVFVTAGHCTEAPAASATIWFEEDVESGIPGNGYPFGGATSFDGTTHTHPLYNPGAFYLFDLGVVKLDGAGNAGLSSYASLPAAGAIDNLGNGRKSAVVEAVGYGLQKINPVMVQADRVRLKADLFVVDTNGVANIGNARTGEAEPSNSMMLSGDAKHGGTCFGDSGGPILIGDSDVIGGVTSFGINGNCAGVGGAFRIDRQLELDWIGGF